MAVSSEKGGSATKLRNNIALIGFLKLGILDISSPINGPRNVTNKLATIPKTIV